jgi:hypothetical protein
MRTDLVIGPIAAAVLCGLLLISQAVTAQNQSSSTNMTSTLSGLTNSTNSSAVGNMSKNIKDVYNTTQANIAMMSNSS